jgi:hypothetical protein
MTNTKTKTKTTKAAAAWRSRIVGHEDVSPAKLIANPFNFRLHSAVQAAAVKGSLKRLGVIKSAIVNKRTGHILDGHLRVSLALKESQPAVPVEYVDLTVAEEREALASIDPLALMATSDQGSVARLMKLVRAGPAADGLALLLTDAGEGGTESRTITTPKGVAVKIGPHRFRIPKKQFENWQSGLRRKVGFSDEAIVAEIRRRLLLRGP